MLFPECSESLVLLCVGGASGICQRADCGLEMEGISGYSDYIPRVPVTVSSLNLAQVCLFFFLIKLCSASFLYCRFVVTPRAISSWVPTSSSHHFLLWIVADLSCNVF